MAAGQVVIPSRRIILMGRKHGKRGITPFLPGKTVHALTLKPKATGTVSAAAAATVGQVTNVAGK
ncbi:MAG: hypothetical protein U1D30_26805 [Planctomycetota bacterium]